jgi:hypothetical protein
VTSPWTEAAGVTKKPKKEHLAMTKLAANLPKGTANGLQVIAQSLVDEPERVHAVIALIDCKKVTTDFDSGEVVPTARIRRIEVIQDGEDLGMAQRVIRRALERRTGKTVLPFDIEDEIASAFDRVRINRETGEVVDD